MWLATSDWQLHHNPPTHASHLLQSFVVKHQITQVIQSPYSPHFVPCDFWLFPKLKSPLKGKMVSPSDHWWDSGKYDRAANGNWENCVRSQGAYFEGGGAIIVLCTMFLLSYIFFRKCLYFSYYMAGYLLDRPCIYGNLSISSVYWEKIIYIIYLLFLKFFAESILMSFFFF